MPIDITMPALSPTMEEGKLAKWHVKEGDTVSSGDVIAEIETDKATMEVEAVDEGKIGKILVAVEHARQGIWRVTLRADAGVPIVVRGGTFLQFNFFQPGIFARGLIKMAVDTKVFHNFF